jgi:transposase
VVFADEGRDSIKELVTHLADHGCPAENIESVSIDMYTAFIKGVSENLPDAQVTFDKFHVVAHANDAVDEMRRIQQRTDKSLKGMRWSLRKR